MAKVSARVKKFSFNQFMDTFFPLLQERKKEKLAEQARMTKTEKKTWNQT